INPFLPALPPNLQNGLRQLAEARSAVLTLNTEAEQVRLTIALEYANRPAADLVAQAVGGLWNGFKAKSSPQILAGLKPFPSYFQALVKDVFANGQVAPTENRVEVVVRLSFPAFQGLVGEVALEGDAEV